MTSPAANQIISRVEATFANGVPWTSPSNVSATAWELPAYHLIWCDEVSSEVEIRRLWEERKGRQAFSVVLLAPAENDGNVRVAGPQDARPVRELPTGRVLELLQAASSMAARQAASFLAREFIRLEDAVVPGLKVKDLLTPHFARERLRWPVNATRLSDALGKTPLTGSIAWRSLFQGMGYQVDQLPNRGYLLRHEGAPVAVVHPYQDPSQFSHLTENEALPEGLVLADCGHHGAQWGILEASGRYRVFQRKPPVGPATGQYLEMDTAELARDDRFYLGLLAPEALVEGGWLTEWVAEAKDFGEELRKGLEDRLSRIALPKIAQGLGEFLESQGADLDDQEQLRQIEEAALTLVFRFMFLLHTEARGYLPLGSSSYRPHSAVQLAEDTLHALSSLSSKSTQRWDRLRTLVRMVRTGDSSANVPAYNGSLFAANGFPGSALLEEAKITDNYLGPVLVSIAYEDDGPDELGLDYAGLQVGHLGAIYESLLALRLTRAPEDLVYDSKREIFRPRRADDKGEPEVTKAQLYYQSEAGGRKAGGVFYTRHEFVEHLLNHSLLPALDGHLEEIKRIADSSPKEAARRLFDFSVVDPAMGSAHFLTEALYVMADRIETFLAEVGGLPGIAQQLSELTHDNASTTNLPDAADLLRRLILKRCIYGVDISPMAVEVANVTLWLASFVPGLALSYLGSNLKCGDALIGVADQYVVGASDSPMFTGQNVKNAMEQAAQLQVQQAAIPDRTPEEVERSKELGELRKEVTSGLRAAFDLWSSEPLGLESARHILETNADYIVESSESEEVRRVIADAEDVAKQFRFFHWPLEFPGVFHRERPGFDVVVGNPPWNEITVEELAFYALRDPGLRGLPNLADRKKRIAELDKQHPDWREEFETQREQLSSLRKFFSAAGGYQLQGVGDKDLYQLFCERYSHLVRNHGWLGVVLPRTAFLAEGARGFREWLFSRTTVSTVDFLLNAKRWAFDMEPRYTVALLTGSHQSPTEGGRFRTTGPSGNLEEFHDSVSHGGVFIQRSSLGMSRVVPLLQTQTHADVLAKLRRGVQFDSLEGPQNGKHSKGPVAAFRVTPYRELDETQQRALFSHSKGVPVWKGRSFGQFDPHGEEPAGFCDWDELIDHLQSKRMKSRVFKRLFTKKVLQDPDTLPVHQCRVAFRDVSRATDSRTVISCLVPPCTPLTNKAPYLLFLGWTSLAQASVLGILNSTSFDWIARRYVETNLNYFILDMLAFPPPSNTQWERIGRLAARLSCVDGRFAEFAAEAGVECGELTPVQRNDMRAEIDALVAHAYGLTADELRFIFTDFTQNAVPQMYRDQVLEKFEGL